MSWHEPFMAGVPEEHEREARPFLRDDCYKGAVLRDLSPFGGRRLDADGSSYGEAREHERTKRPCTVAWFGADLDPELQLLLRPVGRRRVQWVVDHGRLKLPGCVELPAALRLRRQITHPSAFGADPGLVFAEAERA